MLSLSQAAPNSTDLAVRTGNFAHSAPCKAGQSLPFCHTAASAVLMAGKLFVGLMS